MKKAIINILLVFFLGVLLYSGYRLYGIFSEYYKGRSEYKKTSSQYVTKKEESTEHGYGLQNVYAVLDQADAIYLVEYVPEKQSFIFSAQIPLPMQEV